MKSIIIVALLAFLRSSAAADTPPDTVLQATIEFSQEPAVVRSQIAIIMSTESPLGFSTPSPSQGIPSVSVVPIAASSANRNGKDQPAIRLPPRLKGFLALDGTQLYYGKHLIAEDLFREEEPSESGTRHRRTQVNRKLRPGEVREPEAPESKPASASKTLEFIKALGSVRVCAKAIQISVKSVTPDKNSESGRPHFQNAVVSTEKIPCVDVDAALVTSVSNVASASLIYDDPVFYPEFMPVHEVELLKTTPHYACTGAFSYNGEAGSGEADDTFVSYNPAVGAEELRNVCGNFQVPQDLEQAEVDKRVKDAASRGNVFLLTHVDGD